MADNKFVDRTETYLSSPEKTKVSKKTSTVILTESITKGSDSSEASESSPTRKRISSTSWHVTKTTEITDEIKSNQKVSTLEFEIGKSGSASPTASSGQRSFVSSTEFGVSSPKQEEMVFGTAGTSNEGEDKTDPLDEYVFVEAGDVDTVNKSDVTEIIGEQETVAPESKKSYFAYLLDQDTRSANKNKSEQVETNRDMTTNLDVTKSSKDITKNKQDDAAVYERITYTPGLAIRSYAVEEMKTKSSSIGKEEKLKMDSKNNNTGPPVNPPVSPPVNSRWDTSESSQRTSNDDDQTLSPAEGYRISQIFAGEEPEVWERERRRKEQEEYSIIDSLSLDDMMQMLGEHDRMKFDSQVVDSEEQSPFLIGMTKKSSVGERGTNNYGSVETSQKKIESSNAQVDLETRTRDQGGYIQTSETSQRLRKLPKDDKRPEKVHEKKQTDTKVEEVDWNSLSTKVTTSSHVTSVTSGFDSTSSSQEATMRTMVTSEVDHKLSSGSQMIEATQQQGSLRVASQPASVKKEATPSVPVEVERKFNITPDTENRIKRLGGKLTKEKTFSDVYYDSLDYTLTLSDCWLRKRSNKWEMKVAAENLSTRDFVTKYKELTDEKQIMSCLKTKLGISSKFSSVDKFVRANELTDFASITTTRKSYKLSDCSIDLDLTDHGFQVGEIEVMASSSSQIPCAVQAISDVARKLGLNVNTKTYGKMTDYLRRHNLELYNLLVEKHILPPVDVVASSTDIT